jgi:hypothetical protein
MTMCEHGMVKTTTAVAFVALALGLCDVFGCSSPGGQSSDRAPVGAGTTACKESDGRRFTAVLDGNNRDPTASICKVVVSLAVNDGCGRASEMCRADDGAMIRVLSPWGVDGRVDAYADVPCSMFVDLACRYDPDHEDVTLASCEREVGSRVHGHASAGEDPLSPISALCTIGLALPMFLLCVATWPASTLECGGAGITWTTFCAAL